MTKDPIDVASGEVVLRQVDVELAGVLPLSLERTHVSSYRAGRLFGTSWASTLDQRLEFDAEGVCFAAADGMVLAYPPVRLPETPVLPFAGPQWALAVDQDGGHSVTDSQAGRTLHFASAGGGPGVLPLSAISDRNGNRIDLLHDDSGTLVEVRHSGGYRIGVETDATQRVTALRLISDGEGGGRELVRYRYDDNGRLAGVLNSSGRPLRFEYDPHDRLTAWIDRNGHWYRYEYDELGRGVRGHGSDGFLDVALAFEDGLTVVTDALGHRTDYHLNEMGQVVRQVDPLGRATTSEWDRHDRLLSRTDPLGRKTRYSYDEAGDVTAITRPDGRQITAAYNALGRPVRTADAAGRVWRQAYDDRGNVIAVTDPAGVTVRYEYDERGALSAIVDPLGAVTRFVNDGAGLPVTVVDPLEGVHGCVRDRFGRISEIVDPLGGITRIGWTLEGRPASQVLPDGATERWSYDAEGNLVEYTDTMGLVSRTEYAAFDVPAVRIAPDGTRLEFAYDAELRLTAVTNPQELVWRYTYDAAGDLVQETDFNGRAIRYAYDAAGQLAERAVGAGQTTRYSHDLLGNVVRQVSGDGLATFAFDVTGRLVRAVNADADVRFDYDELGRVVAEECNGRRLTVGYDALGRRVRRRTPSGAEADWDYDIAGRPAVLHTAGQTIRFEHDLAGRQVRRHVGDAATLDQEWDLRDRLSRQTLRGVPSATGDPAYAPHRADSAEPGSPLQRRAYSYRPDGGVARIIDQSLGDRTVELDAAGRVTGVHAAGWDERYVYDPAGNPVHATWPETATGGSWDAGAAGGRDYTGTLVRSAGDVRYEYDGRGRVVVRQQRRLSSKPRTWRYAWNDDDRLVAVTTPGGQRWRYLYDALGRRVAKQRLRPDGHSVAEQTDFTWDDVVLAEQTHSVMEDAGAVTRTTAWDYEPGGFRPIAQTERVLSGESPQDAIDERFYGIVTDLTGSPSEMVDSTGDLVWQSVSSAWGIGAPRGSAACPLRFPGQYHDAETGLHYNFQRFYDPYTARYQSPDPLGLSPQPDPHAYVHDPMNWADPLGLAPYALFVSRMAFVLRHLNEPSRLKAIKLAVHDNREMFNRLGGKAPQSNATIRDLLKLKEGNPSWKARAASASSRSDAELLQSVFQPMDGQYMAVHPLYPGMILQGNHRRRELLNRVDDLNSGISLETPIFINNF
ncbi:RHS repeat-associated protein [Actinoallomurus bryophytorum]|uniref:RHS repeat-associated protein n=1 Tax=Actinoallomurus bryophytorum TaxID=1490222 RepID=A0A543CVG0_9ACTN|nr:RHS repeat-associated core domain-containing protein [Actinoallomurus bryophytorum]TQM01087.1 RHS repeat-associated protein [Actinoallomurus bryophytorum]